MLVLKQGALHTLPHHRCSSFAAIMMDTHVCIRPMRQVCTMQQKTYCMGLASAKTAACSRFEANFKIQIDFCGMNTCVCILGFRLISYENNLLHQCCSKTAAPIMQQCTSGQMMQLCTPSRHGRKLRCAWIRVRFSVQGRICVGDILPNSPGWLSTYLKVLGTVHKLLLT